MRETRLPVLNREPAPCQMGCPAGIDVPRYIGYVALGKPAEATAVVRERIPFPSVCSHICYRPCEPVCRRALWESPVAINAIKDAATRRDTELWRERWPETVAEPTGKKVAVIGSGPAGLTAAYYLGKRLGHEVTVFDAASRPGGQLRLGVPANRLPRKVLDEEIAVITETRVTLRLDEPVKSLDALEQQGFDAVFVAAGTMRPRKLGIPGEDLPGVANGVEFLARVNLGVEDGDAPRVGRRVAIVGAGNVAVDCARTALRLGSEEVRVFYRRSRREMPAYDFEMRAAELEGASVSFLAAPTRIERRDDEALDLHLERMELGELDAGGRAAPRAVAESAYAVGADQVLVAIGQVPAVPPTWGLERRDDGTLRVEEGSLRTSKRGVFAGGDVVTGPRNIIEAIAQGRRAASEIDRYLGGTGEIDEILAPPPADEMEYPEIHPHGKACVPMAELPKEERTRGFELVQLGYTEEEARDEALRCVRCDLWSLKGAPRAWWERRGLRPYWQGGLDRRSREQDRAKTRVYGPHEAAYDHAPYIPEEYS